VEKEKNSLRKFTLVAIVLALIVAFTLLLTKSNPNAENGREDSTLSRAEYDFLIMMIPHHLQALEMSELVATRSFNREIRDLAEGIQGAQDPEIQLMRKILADSGVINLPTIDHMHGMLTAQEMRELAKASGESFDRLFLTGMIKHHKGAIDMVALTQGSLLLEELGKEIFQGQKKEIEVMQELLKKIG
jgi:uncharacterized protein (DUF305 family)